MKATLDTPNTLFVAVWSQRGHTTVVGSLRSAAGPLPVLEQRGEQPLPLLADALDDAANLAAAHIIVYTNDPTLAATYRRPIRLEPTTPDRMAHYVPDEWRVLRRLCGYRSWQLIHTTALPKARQLWEETYGNAKRA